MDTQAQQIIFFNDSYREVNGKYRWPYLEAQSVELSTVTGTNAYDLPADMGEYRNIDAVRLQQTAVQNYTNLEYREPQTFRDSEHMDRDTDTPMWWSFFNQQLHFYPYPDDVYNVVIDYCVMPPDLAQDTDTPIFPAVYHDILVWGAVRAIAFRQRDWLGRQFAQTEFEQRLQRMEEEYLIRQRQTATHVKKSGAWNTSLPFPSAPVSS